MKLSKSDAVVLSQKNVICPLMLGGESVPQVDKFMYLMVFFTSRGRMQWEIDKWIRAVSVVMHILYWSVVLKIKLNRKTNLPMSSPKP